MLNFTHGPYRAEGDGGSAAPAAPAAAPEAGGQASVPSTGQAASSAPATASKPFHSWTRDDGSVQDFKTADDLNKYLREGTLMRADYTKKTQEHAKKLKEFEDQKTAYNNEYSTFLGMKNKYDAYDKMLKGLSPQQFNQFFRYVQGAQRTNSPELQSLRMELQAIKDKQKEADEMRAQQANEAMRAKVLDGLGTSIQGFNKDEVLASITELQNRWPADMDENVRAEEEMRALAELVHYAGIGKKRATEMLEEVSANIEKKKAGAQPAPGAPTKGVTQEEVPDTIRGMKEYAKRKLGIK